MNNISCGVGVVVVDPTNPKKILVSKRRAGSKFGHGKWSLPGGKPEAKENLWSTSIRETYEETGLQVRLRVIDEHTYTLHAEEWMREGQHIWTIYTLAEVRGGDLCNPEPDKHDDWEWKTLDELAVLCDNTDWVPIKALLAIRDRFGL